MKRHTLFTHALSLLTAAAIVMQPLTVQAADAFTYRSATVKGSLVSIYEGEEQPEATVSLSGPKLFGMFSQKKLAAGNVCTTVDEAAAAFREGLVARQNHITVNISMQMSQNDLDAMGEQIYYAAINHTGNPVQGDYLKYQFGGGDFSGKFNVTGSHIEGAFTFDVSYYTSAAQEREMDDKVASILSSLNLSGKSDYEKAHAIYKYLTDNVVYDRAHVNDDSYLPQFTGYAALCSNVAVCQGYSVAFYRLALSSGLDARVIHGIGRGGSTNGPHAWNIVRIGGLYYNLDSTWDAGTSSYGYFLKSPGSFDSSHERDAEFLGAFNSSYPMSGSDYDNSAELAAIEAERQAQDAAARAKAEQEAAEQAAREAAERAAREAAEREAQMQQAQDAANNTGSADMVPVVNVNTGTFYDVTPNDYFSSAVYWARERGITDGTSESSFSPAQICTRGQVVTFIWRAQGRPLTGAIAAFADVAAGSYYDEAIKWALQAGITSGTGDGLFSPETGCTRGQVVTFLWRAAGCPVTDLNVSFEDVQPGAYYYDAVRWAVANGITTGTSGSTFSPDAPCDRGQIVTFLYRDYE